MTTVQIVQAFQGITNKNFHDTAELLRKSIESINGKKPAVQEQTDSNKK